MNAVKLIVKKRDGEELSAEEIQAFIKGLDSGDVTDYQATAFLMATFFQGMTLQETVHLTEAMVNSGEHYNLSHIPGPKIDKHSTGGIGDKVSLILAPLAAACGLRVPMMSGRGLGITGGTLDKLESISGFNVRLSRTQFEKVLNEVGVAMIGQSQSMTPADKKLYALRDVSGSVESIPLIVASILSKKKAEGSEGLVLDVKCGSGAFMKNRAAAKALARALIKVAEKIQMPCRALVTNMDQPLGYAIGNSLEVLESIEILKNQKGAFEDTQSCDVRELTLQLTAQMLVLGKIHRSLNDARKDAQNTLSSGKAYEIFEKMVHLQGGNIEQIRHPDRLPISQKRMTWKAKKSGYMARIHSGTLGQILIELGGGRRKVTDEIDPGVGLILHKKLGSRVSDGETLATVFLPQGKNLDLNALEKNFFEAIKISQSRQSTPELVMDKLI